MIASFFQKFIFRVRLPAAAECLFVGLGNPGDAYAATRHNIGFRVAAALAARLDNRVSGSFGRAQFSGGKLFSRTPVLVAQPTTFMNRSGEAVAAYLHRWRIDPARIFVIVDDLNLPLGSLRARRGGSDGGHNGLKSVIAAIGDGFPRLRVGIGPVSGGRVIDFVLGTFTGAEEDVLKKTVPAAVDACMLFAQEGIDTVMNRYNK
ncbi:MAG: aminoacyl-tRNA hydrolase [Chitinispirillaceae bacterium]|nr:aminoacyl-tRNA hydrolase [Chitinispirillaceae bacterium]